MFSHFRHHLPHYFHRPLTRSMTALYTTVGLQDFALAMMILFEPVYLYRLGYSVSHIALFYALVYIVFVFVIPLGGKFVARYGPPKSILLSRVFLISYYLSILGMARFPELFVIAPILFGLEKSFFWPGYHTDFIRSSDQGERGKEFSALYSLTTLTYIVGPAIGGLIITWFGFPALFVLGAIIILAANIPLFSRTEAYPPEKFSYLNSFILPFTKRHRRSALAYLGFGEQLLLVYIWPIYLAIAFGTIQRLGWLVALATLITAVITLLIGRVYDSGHWHRMLRAGAWLSALNWILRPFFHLSGAVFTSTVTGQISQNMTFVTLSDVAYDRAIRENNPIGRSILFEQGLSFGKILAALALAFFSQFFSPFPTAFVIGGIFSLLYLRFR